MLRAFCIRHKRFVATATMVAGVAVAGVAGFAQTQTDTISVIAGDVFEMTVDTAIAQPEYSWILTRERQFINAQRTAFFQTRQSVAGSYVLDVNLQDTNINQTEYHAFTIVMRPPESETSQPALQNGDQPLTAVLQSEPATVDGKLYMPARGGIVKLIIGKSTGLISRYSLDLDSTIDRNGDGNPENDRDNEQTIGENDGTPLFLYLMPKPGPRRIILTVLGTDQTKQSTSWIEVVFTDNPPPPSSTAQSASSSAPGGTVTIPVATGNLDVQADGLTVRLKPKIDASLREGKQLLVEWDFGDKARSLLDNPQHTYATPGIYAVSFTVRDIFTGQVVLSGSQSVQVLQKPDAVVSSASSSSATTTESSSSKPSGTPSSGGFGIGSVLRVGLILLFIIGLGIGLFVLFTWIKRKTAGRLQQTLEKMEGAIVTKEATPGDAPVETLKLKKQPKQKKEVEPEAVMDPDMLPQEPKAEAASQPLVAEPGPVPDWLKGAPSSVPPVAQVQSQVPVEPTPAPVAQEPVPDWLKPTPVTETATPAQQPQTTDAAPVPDWLKPATPSAAPAAVAPVEPAPAPADAPVPDWLKPAAPAVPAAPAPEAPATPVADTSAPVPDWLKPAAAATPAPTVTEQPQATPVAPVQEAPKPETLVEPAPQAPVAPVERTPIPADGPVPDWLKPKPLSEPAAQTPVTPVAEVKPPEPVQEAPKEVAAVTQTTPVAETPVAPAPAPVEQTPPAPPVAVEPTPAPVVADVPKPAAQEKKPEPKPAQQQKPNGGQQQKQNPPKQKQTQPQQQNKNNQQKQGQSGKPNPNQNQQQNKKPNNGQKPMPTGRQAPQQNGNQKQQQPKPAQTPKTNPPAPKPATAPVQPVAEPVIEKPVTPAPVAVDIPKAPASATLAPAETVPAANADEKPIVFIQADSISGDPASQSQA